MHVDVEGNKIDWYLNGIRFTTIETEAIGEDVERWYPCLYIFEKGDSVEYLDS